MRAGLRTRRPPRLHPCGVRTMEPSLIHGFGGGGGWRRWWFPTGPPAAAAAAWGGLAIAFCLFL